MIKIKEVISIEKIHKQREKYMKTLPFSQEHFLEVMVSKSNYYVIEINSEVKGYFCVNTDKVLCEFYLAQDAVTFGQDVFKTLLDEKYFIAAECKTFDYLFMSLCSDFQKKVSSTGYIFREFIDVKNSLDTFDNLSFRLANLDECKKISDISGDFFENLEDEITKEEIFVLYSKDILIGAGLAVQVFPGLNYYDIGMVVNEEHRNKGVGTYIITKLKEYCCSNNYIPICGCWYYNYASKKTLSKCGFISKHRILRFDFFE